MKRSVTYSVLAAAIFSALSFPALAADNADSNVTTKDVIVTATRTEQEVKNVPSASQVITSEDIQKLGATDVYQALSLADGVSVYSNGTSGFGKRVTIRNMPSHSALVLVDGRRVASEDTELSNQLVLGRLNVNNIDRIEIVRGAASAQYGSDAQSGVINIITKKAKAKESLTAGFSTGTESINNYYHVDTGDIGKFSGSIDVNIGKDRNRIMGDGTGALYGPKQNISLDGTYKFNDHQSLNINASYYKSKQLGDWSGMMSADGDINEGMKGMTTGLIAKKLAEYHRYDLMGQLDTLTDKLYNKYFGMYDLNKAKLDSEQKDFNVTFSGKTDKNDYTIRTYYSHLNNTRFMPYVVMATMGKDIIPNIYQDVLHVINPNNPEGTAPNYYENNKFTIYGVEARNSMAINDNHLLTFGGEYETSKVEGNNMHGLSKDTDTYAGYIQDEWMVGDKLLIIPAVRYDHNSRFGSKTTPKIGATYFINNNNRVKINWGKGFRAPTVTQMYANFSHAGVTIIGNQDLKAEESKNFDISYETEFGNNFGKITYFNNDVENMIAEVTQGSVAQYQNNEGTTKLHGVELTLGRHFNDNWTFQVNSNWTNANRDTIGAGHDTTGVAKNITTAQVAYDDLNPYGFNFTLWDQMNYKYKNSGKEYTYNTLNFVVNKKFGEGKRIFVGIDNIFDKEVGVLDVDGRMWKAGAEVKF